MHPPRLLASPLLAILVAGLTLGPAAEAAVSFYSSQAAFAAASTTTF